MPFHCPRPERPISPEEAAVLQWLLEHAHAAWSATLLESPVEELRVVGGCDCGCASLDFAPNASSDSILADAWALYPDGKKAGLILWGRLGVIQWLEVYEMHPVADRFPAVSDLRTFEQWCEEPNA